jgi:hypothetical protein
VEARRVIVGDPAGRARELVVFCDGAEEAGLVGYARRARVVARDVLELVVALEGERSARVAMQEARDQLQEIVGKGTYYMCIAEAEQVQAVTIAKREFAARTAAA